MYSNTLAPHPEGFGHQRFDALPGDLRFRIPEHPSAGRVEHDDAAGLVDGDDGVQGRVDDAFEPLLQFLHLLSGLEPPGNVAHRGHGVFAAVDRR
jgi:hypothetical protein